MISQEVYQAAIDRAERAEARAVELENELLEVQREFREVTEDLRTRGPYNEGL